LGDSPLHGLRSRNPRAARVLPGSAGHRDRGGGARGRVPGADPHPRAGRPRRPGDGGGPVNGLLYMRYELIRALRNRRFFFFSLGFPLILYFVIAGPQSSDKNFAGSGIPAALFYLAGLVSFGTMSSMISTGARI